MQAHRRCGEAANHKLLESDKMLKESSVLIQMSCLFMKDCIHVNAQQARPGIKNIELSTTMA